MIASLEVAVCIQPGTIQAERSEGSRDTLHVSEAALNRHIWKKLKCTSARKNSTRCARPLRGLGAASPS